jgi:O-antigen/teichoic acid export membrane protein
MSTRKALAFSFIDRYASLLVTIGSSMVIARLLPPSELGLFSVTMVFVTFVNAIRDLGAGQYLVQERELTADRVAATWTLLLGMGIALGVLVLVLSVPIARVYGEPRMTQIMGVVSLCFVVNPVGSLTYAHLTREMRFDAIAVMRFTSTLTGAVSSIALAHLGFGPVSLAIGNLSAVVANALVGLAYRPAGLSWRLSFKEARRVFQFGSNISAMSITGHVAGGAPELLLGKLQSLESAGLYSRAAGLASMFNRLVLDAVAAVALPMFAKSARQSRSGAEEWALSVSYMTVLGWPFLGGLMLLAFPATRLLYGDQWDAAVGPTQALAVGMALWLPAALCQHMLIATGHAKKVMQTMLASTAMQICFIAAGATAGLNAAAVGFACGQAAASLIWLRAMKRVVPYRMRALAAVLSKSLVVAAITLLPATAAVVVYGWQPALVAPSLVMGGLGGLLVFLPALWIVNHPFVAEVKRVRDAAWRKGRTQ